MKCPKCQHENPDNAKFCMQCGEKLEIVCPECGAKLPPEARFCMECGTRIGEAVPQPSDASVPRLEDMHTNLQRYIPQSLAERMQTHGREMEGETRLVTAMFADISGFTPASAQMTPEELTDMANDCFKAIVDTICAYEGSVNRFLGDCVLAFFGAPIAHENDPERAIRAGLDMCDTTFSVMSV